MFFNTQILKLIREIQELELKLSRENFLKQYNKIDMREDSGIILKQIKRKRKRLENLVELVKSKK